VVGRRAAAGRGGRPLSWVAGVRAKVVGYLWVGWAGVRRHGWPRQMQVCCVGGVLQGSQAARWQQLVRGLVLQQVQVGWWVLVK
jgi:hypothetical protein